MSFNPDFKGTPLCDLLHL